MSKNKNTRQWSAPMKRLEERLKKFDWSGINENIDDLDKISADEVFPAVYGVILAACYTIPVENTEIPDSILRVLDVLNQRGYDTNTVAPNKATLLSKAAEAIQPGLIRYLISQGADPNINTTFGTAMHVVIGRWFNIVFDDKYNETTRKQIQPLAEQSITMLMEAGYDINIENSHCAMPIVSLTMIRSLEMVSLLLDYGAPFSTVTDPKKVLLETVIDYGTPEILRLLIEYGLDIQNTLLTRKVTPLKYALKKGKNEIAQIISEAIEHPEHFLRKYPTKGNVANSVQEKSRSMNNTEDEVLWDILNGEWIIDINATAEYCVKRERVRVGDSWQIDMEEKTRQYWHDHADSLSDIVLSFMPGTLILLNNEDEESYSARIELHDAYRQVLIPELCENPIAIIEYSNTQLVFEADNCALSGVVWCKKL